LYHYSPYNDADTITTKNKAISVALKLRVTTVQTGQKCQSF